MWMAALQKEYRQYKAGSMFRVRKTKGAVIAEPLDLNGEVPVIDKIKEPILIGSTHAAQMMFTKPTQDLPSLMEDSIMICEREYC